MALITYLGGEETGDRGTLPWGRFVFELNRAIECDDPHIVKKARTNKFFRVDDGPPVAPNGFNREGIPRRGRPPAMKVPVIAVEDSADPEPSADDSEVI